MHIIWWIISQYFTVADILQQLDKWKRNRQIAIALIFIKKKDILLNDINKLKHLNFVNLQSYIKMSNKVGILGIVLKFYKCNL